MISSSSNSQIKNIGKLLKVCKARKAQGLYVVEGKKMFLEAKSLGLVEMAYLSEELYEEWRERNILEDINYEVVTKSVMQAISDTKTPQGVVATVRMQKKTLHSILDKEDVKLLFLENIRDPGNLGTMVRAAEGAGMTGIILNQDSVDIYNPKVVRSTMGSIFRVPFLYVEDWMGTLDEVKQSGVTLFATHLKGEKFYDEVSYAGKVGILIGNEANGLTDDTANSADTYIKIPMCGKVESLNAGVAASLMMYEVYRQERKQS